MKELKKREGREKAGEVEWSERVEGGKGREEEVKREGGYCSLPYSPPHLFH